MNAHYSQYLQPVFRQIVHTEHYRMGFTGGVAGDDVAGGLRGSCLKVHASTSRQVLLAQNLHATVRVFEFGIRLGLKVRPLSARRALIFGL